MMIVTPQFWTYLCTHCEQVEQRVREDRELAVVDRKLELRTGLLQLLLQLRADEQRFAESGAGTRRHALQRAAIADQRVAAFDAAARNHRSRPSAARQPRRSDAASRPSSHRRTPGGTRRRPVVDAELLVLLAVVHGRTAERIALDVEHRTLLRIHVTRKLHVRGRLPVAARGVLHVVDHCRRRTGPA